MHGSDISRGAFYSHSNRSEESLKLVGVFCRLLEEADVSLREQANDLPYDPDHDEGFRVYPNEIHRQTRSGDSHDKVVVEVIQQEYFPNLNNI